MPKVARKEAIVRREVEAAKAAFGPKASKKAGREPRTWIVNVVDEMEFMLEAVDERAAKEAAAALVVRTPGCSHRFRTMTAKDVTAPLRQLRERAAARAAHGW